MNTTIGTTILALLLAGVVCACGSPQGTHPLTGTYVLEPGRTAEASAMLKGTDPGAATALLRENFAPDVYRLELRADSAFELIVTQGEENFTLSGTWGDAEDGLVLRTRSVNGQPPGTDAEEDLVETVGVEGEDTLVLTQGDVRIFLVRQ